MLAVYINKYMKNNKNEKVTWISHHVLHSNTQDTTLAFPLSSSLFLYIAAVAVVVTVMFFAATLNISFYFSLYSVLFIYSRFITLTKKNKMVENHYYCHCSVRLETIRHLNCIVLYCGLYMCYMYILTD